MIKHGIWLALLALLLAGCSSIGPNSVHHDRFDYNKALSDPWKEQTLLNIVRLRYADMPIFLEVASIIRKHISGSRKWESEAWYIPSASIDLHTKICFR